MTQLSIKVDGELVRKGLQNLAAEVPKIGRLQIYQTEQAIVRRMKIYPPERIDQKYIRTGRLGHGWTITSLPNGYTLSNDTPYTKYVVGNAYGLEQAWMHISTDQGKRWNLLRDVQDEEVEKLPKEIDDAIIVVARREGL
jgi:hypothetical protein